MPRHIITVSPNTMPGDADLCFAFKCPADALGGGLTVVEAVASTGAAGTLDLLLVNYGTSGTVVGGTIARHASGTATVWAADTPKALTITAAQAYVDAGEYVYLKKLEPAGSNDLTADAMVQITLVDGIVEQG